MRMLMRFFNSIRDAVRGIKHVFISEQNFRIQLVIGILVLILAVYFPLKTWEFILIVLIITLVLVMEMLNTALEYFADLLKPRLHHYVLLVKDIMAATVFLTSVGAAIIGVIIFFPHFYNLWK